MKGAVARKFIGEDRYIDLPRLAVRAHRRIRGGNTVHRRALDRRGGQIGDAADRLQHRRDIGVHVAAIASGRKLRLPAIAADADLGRAVRSEEHTSELQSLMRTSYAVFCLKKKNKTHIT